MIDLLKFLAMMFAWVMNMTPVPIQETIISTDSYTAPFEQTIKTVEVKQVTTYVPKPTVVSDLRGDADGNGVIGIGDVLAIKQYLVGQAVNINLANASGTNHDEGGDRVTIADALAIEQYLVGQRDSNFNWINR